MAGLRKKLLDSASNVLDNHVGKIWLFAAAVWSQNYKNYQAHQDYPIPETTKEAKAPSLSDEKFRELERKALTLENADDIAIYEGAVLGKYFPQFTHNGAPRYYVRPRDKVNDQEIETALRASYDPEPNVKNAFGLLSRKISDEDMKNYLVTGGEKLAQINAQAGSLVGGSTSPFSLDRHDWSNKNWFATANFDRNLCPSCNDTKHQFDCSKIQDPLNNRFQKFARFFTAEHETGHVISHLSGARHERDKKSDNVLWQMGAEENLANTYASLRLISQFGAEAVAYIERRRYDDINNINHLVPEDSGKKKQSYFSHWSVLSYDAVLQKYGKNPEALAKKTPNELFAEAQKIMRPLSSQAVAEITSHIDTADLTFANVPKSPDTELFILSHFPSATPSPEYEKGIKAMPNVPSSANIWSYENVNLAPTPKELIDLAKFDAARTKDICEQPTSERFQNAFSLDKEKTEAIRKAVDEPTKKTKPPTP